MELTTPLEKITRLDDTTRKALTRLSLQTVEDLLFYFPVRYSHISEVTTLATLSKDTHVTVFGSIKKLKIKKAFRGNMLRAEAVLIDAQENELPIMWFNQQYIAKMLEEGSLVELTGKVMQSKKGFYLANPEFKKIQSLPIDSSGTLWKDTTNDTQEHFGYPIYPETRGLSSKWIYHTLQKILKSGLTNTIPEHIPENILTKYKLPKIATALVWIHTPKNENDASVARKRFAFDEIFTIQLQRTKERIATTKEKAYDIIVDKKEITDFISRFPFTPTRGQYTAIDAILEDIEKPHPMARLLEGDVGSGKTAIAATACFAVIKNRPRGQNFGTLQVAYMAPTEILATQHFENFIQYFTHTGISIGLITSSGCRKFPSKVATRDGIATWTDISRTQLLKWVANGEIPILIGTHALIQKTVAFKHLALTIVDEQHRFGTTQRAKLARKEGHVPHFLSMTATPIPRTLALTVYGDLDLTLLDEMPKGRKPIVTKIVYGEKRKEVYDEIRSELDKGRQAYIICPRIDEADETKAVQLQMKSVNTEAKRLKKDIFKDKEIGILHSKMSKQKKEEVMESFLAGTIDILVATSVVEVGVNVPNATMIIIEGAERFGLAQLHQLRGRVIRSNHQAYCYIFSESKTEKTTDRLDAFIKAKNGFELAELDLALRGAGELAGIKQWGISDLGMEAIKNIKMVEAARSEAQQLINDDFDLKKYPRLQDLLAEQNTPTHFE